MQNFLRIADGLNTASVLRELVTQPELWDQNTLRTSHHDTAHADVSDIWLWFNEIPDTPDTPDTVINDIQTVEYPAWVRLPSLRRMVLDLIHRVNGVQLGRCIITKLPPGGEITPHVDGGAPAEFYTRYQIALQSLPGALFNSGDETVNFRGGEIWWVNNRVTHSVVNNSADDRIVCIVDIRSA